MQLNIQKTSNKPSEKLPEDYMKRDSVQFSCSVMSNSETPWTAACHTSLSITNSWSLLKLTSVESVMPPTISSSVVPFSSCLQSFPATQFIESGGQSIGSFSFSISPSNEHSGLISFRINLFHLLAVQGTLKSLLQHHSSKASILQCSAFL